MIHYNNYKEGRYYLYLSFADSTISADINIYIDTNSTYMYPKDASTTINGACFENEPEIYKITVLSAYTYSITTYSDKYLLGELYRGDGLVSSSESIYSNNEYFFSLTEYLEPGEYYLKITPQIITGGCNMSLCVFGANVTVTKLSKTPMKYNEGQTLSFDINISNSELSEYNFYIDSNNPNNEMVFVSIVDNNNNDNCMSNPGFVIGKNWMGGIIEEGNYTLSFTPTKYNQEDYFFLYVDNENAIVSPSKKQNFVTKLTGKEKVVYKIEVANAGYYNVTMYSECRIVGSLYKEGKTNGNTYSSTLKNSINTFNFNYFVTPGVYYFEAYLDQKEGTSDLKVQMGGLEANISIVSSSRSSYIKNENKFFEFTVEKAGYYNFSFAGIREFGIAICNFSTDYCCEGISVLDSKNYSFTTCEYLEEGTYWLEITNLDTKCLNSISYYVEGYPITFK